MEVRLVERADETIMRRPKKNGGIARPRNESPVETLSNHEYCFTAEITPTPTPTTM